MRRAGPSGEAGHCCGNGEELQKYLEGKIYCTEQPTFTKGGYRNQVILLCLRNWEDDKY